MRKERRRKYIPPLFVFQGPTLGAGLLPEVADSSMYPSSSERRAGPLEDKVLQQHEQGGSKRQSKSKQLLCRDFRTGQGMQVAGWL